MLRNMPNVLTVPDAVIYPGGIYLDTTDFWHCAYMVCYFPLRCFRNCRVILLGTYFKVQFFIGGILGSLLFTLVSFLFPAYRNCLKNCHLQFSFKNLFLCLTSWCALVESSNSSHFYGPSNVTSLAAHVTVYRHATDSGAGQSFAKSEILTKWKRRNA